jgi:arylsulfatase A-like enzyme
MLVYGWWMLIACIVDSQNLRAADLAQPNVVIFLADDAGWGDYSHSGNQQISTPHIDSIANTGVSFDHFYVCPVCAPTRAEFLTGRYHPRGGVRGVSTGQERLDVSEKTVADAYSAAGYATGAFGKWHNGSQWPYHPMARGFNEYFGYTSGHWGEYFDPPLEDNGQMVRTKGYIADICTDRALNFIDRHQQQNFLCYIPFTTPHSPWSAKPEDWAQYKDIELIQHATLSMQEKADETRCAYAMLANQDMNVGRVLQKLDDLNLTENTIVLYFSDNGPNSWRWNGGMKGRKGSTDEGGIRSVCYLKWPNHISAGKTVTEIAGAIDLLPTLLSISGVSRVGDKPLDGRDLSLLLQADKVDWDDRMIFSTWAGKVSVRTQRYRYDDQGKLYDMVDDPVQTKPINEMQPELALEFAAAVKLWRMEMFGDETVVAGKKSQLTSPKYGGNNAIDPRPIPVGYREFPITMLPARDGEPVGQVQRSSKAPNCSYFVNWKSTDDRLVWLVDVHTTGRYEVTIDYTCPLKDVGATIELALGESRLTGQVESGWDPPLNTNQDTLPRPDGESQMKEFHTLNLGIIELTSGQGPLTLRAKEIPGNSVMDLRRVTLTLLP